MKSKNFSGSNADLEETILRYVEQNKIDSTRASQLFDSIKEVSSRQLDSLELWSELTRSVLKESDPLMVKQGIFKWVYQNWPESNLGPPPVWIPTQKEIESTNAFKFMKNLGFTDFQSLWKFSVNQREEFWSIFLRRFSNGFDRAAEKIFDVVRGTAESPRLLAGAKWNVAQMCLSADSSRVAIKYTNELDSRVKEISYGRLREKVVRISQSLKALGLQPGDAVAIDMPMTPESVAIYLGVLWYGCAVVSIADSFAPDEIATRIRISQAKAIFTQDFVLRGGKALPLYEKVKLANCPKAIVIFSPRTPEEFCESSLNEGVWGASSLRSGDLAWPDFVKLSKNDLQNTSPALCDAECAANILFSSGTTGDPKAIVWSHATPFKCAMDAYFHHDIQELDVLAWPTNLGWMMGPWLIFAGLMNRACIALFDGAPHTREFGEFVAKANVSVLGLVPSLVKAWRATGVMEGLNWSKIKAFSSTGESSNSDDYFYLMSLAGFRPVVEYCGGTEIGGGFLSQSLMQPAIPSTFSTPTLGLDVELLGESGNPENYGELFVVPPSLGLSQKLLNRDHFETYFKDCPRHHTGVIMRRHGDQMEKLPNGYFRALGRADDTMNLGGIKISSAEIERVVNLVEGVLETAAVAKNPPGGGPSLLVVFTVLKPGVSGVDPQILKTEMQKEISAKLNPLFRVSEVRVIDHLPRTASNKVMRRMLR